MFKMLTRLNAAKMCSSRSLSSLSRSAQTLNLPMSTSAHASQNQFDRQSVGALDELERTFVRSEFFCQHLKQNDFHFYCGVPDSLLKDLCGYITDNIPANNHMIVPNEGCAIGVAAGYHLNTGRIPVVYFQNSGLGNAVNPLLSLSHQNVYSIPMLLLIGWRGEVGKKDEPQHLVTGRIMIDMLKLLDIPFDVLPDYEEGIQHSVQTAAHYMRNNNAPYALLVRKRTFLPYDFQSGIEYDEHLLSRKEAIQHIVDNVNGKSAFIPTTGFTSRELYEIRRDLQGKTGNNDVKEFLTVGSMGHASAIALGMAQSCAADTARNVVCIDGDGALLMHLGTMSLVGHSRLSNMKHVLINNGCHDSVGGQPTTTSNTDFVAIAKACGYKHCVSVSNKDDVIAAVQDMDKASEGPYFLEINTKPGASKNLARPKSTPLQNKHDFMTFINKTN